MWNYVALYGINVAAAMLYGIVCSYSMGSAVTCV